MRTTKITINLLLDDIDVLLIQLLIPIEEFWTPRG
jgi:hypothetical protein